MIISPPLNSLRLAGMSLLASIPLAQAQTLIDVSFPDGTGTSPLFLEIDNGVGDNSWTQETGVISTSVVDNNSTGGAASDLMIDFSALGSESLTLNVEVASVSGVIQANGMFIGFQRRVAEGAGTDLWNNLATSFGLVIPGSNFAGGGGTRNVGIGGNSGIGRYVEVNYGLATVESIQDGFSMTLEVSSAGWEVAIVGLETAAGLADITGGSGTWGTGGITAWADFESDMRVGTSYQTTVAGGDLTLSKVSLIQGAGDALPRILSVERDLDEVNPGATITWVSIPGVRYGVDFSTDLVTWSEAADGQISNESTATYFHEFLPTFPELVDGPRLFYRIRLE